MVPLLVGQRQSLGGVTAKVKRLEQDRDAGAVTSAGRATPPPIPCAATSAGSRELVRIRCRVPVPAHSYEFVRFRARSQLGTFLPTVPAG